MSILPILQANLRHHAIQASKIDFLIFPNQVVIIVPTWRQGAPEQAEIQTLLTELPTMAWCKTQSSVRKEYSHETEVHLILMEEIA